jgi:flagellar biosynthesis/type III secretory pathway M-ring protein FliF/YscJ
MDTVKIIEIDTVAAKAAEQLAVIAEKPDPFAIFVMGMVGVIVFIVLYVVMMKIVSFIINKNRKNKQEQV